MSLLGEYKNELSCKSHTLFRVSEMNYHYVVRYFHILILGLFAKQPRAKYKSYKGEVGKTCNNKLLIMEVDETNHKTILIRAGNIKWNLIEIY